MGCHVGAQARQQDAAASAADVTRGETSHVSSVGLVCARAGGGFVRFRHRRVRMFG